MTTNSDTRRDYPRRRPRHPDALEAREGAARDRRRTDDRARDSRVAAVDPESATRLCSSSVIRRARSRPPRTPHESARYPRFRNPSAAPATPRDLASTQIPDDFAGDVLITYGDMPRITAATLRAFHRSTSTVRRKLSFISVMLEDPAAYGRVVRDASGNG